MLNKMFSAINTKKLVRLAAVTAAKMTLVLASMNAFSAQQYQGFCSYVKMEIQQQMAIERTGFLATLEVTNNESDAIITDFSAMLTFSKTILDENEEPIKIESSDLFFVQPPTLRGITSIDGRGQIAPGETATVEWFIIPKITAGGESPLGLQYNIGANLAGSIYGLEIAPEILEVIPDTITVRPEPQLEITYFQPRDVEGDDPFTMDIVEPSVPFTLGVLVKNVGFGQANKVTVDSEQPRLVEDPEGLLMVPKLLSARISDEPLSGTPSLKLNLGNIPPQDCRKGAWDMITTLSGEFTEFNARYTHADELGGQATSLIKSINAFFMVREVLNDQPGRDNLFDFLATTDKSQTDLIPDTLYESDCNTLPVNHLLQVSAEQNGAAGTKVSAVADFENWVFIRTNDPQQGKYEIESVIRSDGKVLNPRNYWKNTRYQEFTNNQLNYLNIFDFVSLGEYEYEVRYALPENDLEAPVSTLQFSGEHEYVGETVFVTPETQMFFLVEDISTVGTFYRTDGGEFVPAYPFTIEEPGNYTLEFYSEDAAENIEETQSVSIVVAGGYPEIENFGASTSEILIAGDSISVRDTEAQFSADATTSAATLVADLEVYSGVFAWPTLTNIPSTPTSQDSATISVGGNNVDFYRFKLNGGDWSTEAPVADPIELTGLEGDVTLIVSARNEFGGYFEGDEGLLTANWTVDSDAPEVTFLSPETPTRNTDATINVQNVDEFRFSINGGYYHAPQLVNAPISLNRLSEQKHTVSVIGKTGGTWQDQESATSVSWIVDRSYGYELPENALIYSEHLGNVSGQVRFSWDGHLASGAPAPYGWYTVKFTLTDGLNRKTTSTKLVQVGDLLPDRKLLSGNGVARQSEVDGRGKWSVWQDQRSGVWNIYAKDVLTSESTELAITDSTLNQEKPDTDGNYVVWQARQADGNTDIWVKSLDDNSDPYAVTTTSTQNEVNPVIDYPWVVYQRKSNTSSSNVPWQLFAKNLISQQETAIDLTSSDQINPAIHKSRVVWEDSRDVGSSEIYMKDLRTGIVTRITSNIAGQYHPSIEDQWVVWADNRTNNQLDLYAYNILRGVEIQLTDTVEDESKPSVNGEWVVFEEDSSGELQINLRLLYLPNSETVQLTNAPSNKETPRLVSGKVVWTDVSDAVSSIRVGTLPNLKPVFENQNMIAVTDGLLRYKQTAGQLLQSWSSEAGVIEITRYNQFLPAVVTDTITWDNGVVGDDFELANGDFLWVKFNSTKILDFSTGECSNFDLPAGVNVLVNQCIPDDFTAYRLLNSLGKDKVNAVRSLDSQSGKWQVATVSEGKIIGENFELPPMSVVLIDASQEISNWTPVQ